jgi:hypothetical protein
MLDILMLAIPVACCSWTIAETEVFRSVRESIARWAGWNKGTDAKGWKQKVAYLPSCYYCTSHYVALAFLALHPFTTLTPDVRGYAVSWFSIVGVSAVYLTTYNGMRVALRWGQAVANTAEVVHKSHKHKHEQHTQKREAMKAA